MKIEIKTQADLNGAVKTLLNCVTGMCNSNSMEQVVSLFTDTKDLLIAIYKFKVSLIEKTPKN